MVVPRYGELFLYKVTILSQRRLTMGRFCFTYKSYMKPYAEAFYKSKAWKQCRASYMEGVAGLCEDCLRNGIYTPAEIVHHVIPLSPDNITDPSITLNFDNLRAVCRECHAKAHGARKRRYKIDAIGRVEILE